MTETLNHTSFKSHNLESSPPSHFRAMKAKSSLLATILHSCAFIAAIADTADIGRFLSCLASANVMNVTVHSSAHSSSYYHLLNSSIHNLRFTDTTVLKPVAIVLPCDEHELQQSIVCSRNHSVAIRLRSGGHSYEGLSYTSDHNVPFTVIDLMNLNRVRVNLADSTAWVESGTTLGELYLSVASESGGSLGFPAGSCSTVGTGGHIAGGGFGLLSRKFGLAADNVLDAVIVDSVGRVMDRVGMGDDVFWAVRGGGGGSWGAIYAWKLRLVPVPDRVTVFSLRRRGPTLAAARLVHKWQYIGPSLPDELYLSTSIVSDENGAISTSFNGLVLGPSELAISILARWFPELGLAEPDCKEMSWIESVVHDAGLDAIQDLKDRVSPSKAYFKAKSDYVRTPMPLMGLVGAFDMLATQPRAYVIFDPYGGAMARAESYEIPFPHRRGNLYCIQYMIEWTEKDDGGRAGYIEFVRRLYEYMTPFVSMGPRAAYVNYLDMDMALTRQENGSDGPRDAVSVARVWGEKYFLGNFDRLVRAKTSIDPENVFSNAMSIPPLGKC